MYAEFKLLGVVIGLGGLYLLGFRPGRRKAGAVAAGIGALVWMIGSTFQNHQALYEAARAKGFSSHEEMQAARSAGFDDSESYRAFLNKRELAIAQAEEEEARAKAAAQAAEERQCRNELRCWAEKFKIDAAVSCKPVVERLARYDVQWTDKFLEPKFSHFRWKDKDLGVVSYIGDKIKFQNGFGAWSAHVYECDYDTGSKKVVDARAFPGRLPD